MRVGIQSFKLSMEYEYFFLFLCDGLCEVSWWVFENGIEVTFKLSSRDSDDLVEQMGVTLTVLLSDKA